MEYSIGDAIPFSKQYSNLQQEIFHLVGQCILKNIYKPGISNFRNFEAVKEDFMFLPQEKYFFKFVLSNKLFTRLVLTSASLKLSFFL